MFPLVAPVKTFSLVAGELAERLAAWRARKSERGASTP